MLKDHGTFPMLINKAELQNLFRQINTKFFDRSDLQALDYNGYLKFMLQLAFFCFTRPPKDLSHLPPVETIRSLVNHFESATRARGNSTVLYEDPDAISVGDKDLVKALNEKLKFDPTYPIPEGFFKQIEKSPIYDYRMPDSAVEIVEQSQIVAVELLDELLNKTFGFHFLEPIVSFEERTKVKPLVRNLYKPQAEALNYMKKVEKKVKPIEDKLNEKAHYSAKEKRHEALEVKPVPNVTLKLEVAKHSLKERPHV